MLPRASVKTIIACFAVLGMLASWVLMAELLQGVQTEYPKPFALTYVIHGGYVAVAPAWLLIRRWRLKQGGTLPVSDRSLALWSLLFALLGAAVAGTWYISLTLTSVGVNNAIYQSSSAFVFILSSVLLGDLPNVAKMVACALSLGGVAVITFGNQSSPADPSSSSSAPANTPTGIALVLLSTFLYSLYEVSYARITTAVSERVPWCRWCRGGPGGSRGTASSGRSDPGAPELEGEEEAAERRSESTASIAGRGRGLPGRGRAGLWPIFSPPGQRQRLLRSHAAVSTEGSPARSHSPTDAAELYAAHGRAAAPAPYPPPRSLWSTVFVWSGGTPLPAEEGTTQDRAPLLWQPGVGADRRVTGWGRTGPGTRPVEGAEYPNDQDTQASDPADVLGAEEREKEKELLAAVVHQEAQERKEAHSTPLIKAEMAAHVLSLMGVWSILCLWPVFFILAALGVERPQLPSPHIAGLLALNALLDSLYNICLLLGIGLLSPLTMSLASVLVVPVSVLADWVLHGVRPGPSTGAGCAMLCLGFVMMQLQ